MISCISYDAEKFFIAKEGAMDTLLEEARTYLREVLGIGGLEKSWQRPWPASNQLPFSRPVYL
jgi:hypothetical protein